VEAIACNAGDGREEEDAWVQGWLFWVSEEKWESLKFKTLNLGWPWYM
jgi:hypothetical protein